MRTIVVAVVAITIICVMAMLITSLLVTASITIQWGATTRKNPNPYLLDNERDATDLAETYGGRVVARINITWPGGSTYIGSWTEMGRRTSDSE